MCRRCRRQRDSIQKLDLYNPRHACPFTGLLIPRLHGERLFWQICPLDSHFQDTERLLIYLSYDRAPVICVSRASDGDSRTIISRTINEESSELLNEFLNKPHCVKFIQETSKSKGKVIRLPWIRNLSQSHQLSNTRLVNKVRKVEEEGERGRRWRRRRRRRRPSLARFESRLRSPAE